MEEQNKKAFKWLFIFHVSICFLISIHTGDFKFSPNFLLSGIVFSFYLYIFMSVRDLTNKRK